MDNLDILNAAITSSSIRRGCLPCVELDAAGLFTSLVVTAIVTVAGVNPFFSVKVCLFFPYLLVTKATCEDDA